MTYLYDKNGNDSKFAFSSTVNWIKALKFYCENINKESLNISYKNIKKDNKFNEKSFEYLISSINYLKSIRTFNDNNLSCYYNANLAIIGWYYSIFFAAKAINLAFNKSDAETHSKVADVFIKVVENKNIIFPFNFIIKDTTKHSIEKQRAHYNKGHSKDSLLNENNSPKDDESSTKCLVAYLVGTAENKNEKIKKKLINSSKFGYKNFRTKEAQIKRDEIFKKKQISFINQAIRYRGKANYRDFKYFYENKDDKRLNEFFSDLSFVAHKFMLMVSIYVSKRAGKNWETFKKSLDEVDRNELD